MSAPPLPAGFTVRLGARTRARDSGRTLVGGSGTVLHLRPRARLVLSDDGSVVAHDADSRTVARLLLDRGLADPSFPPGDDGCDDRVTDVTVVVPVRDRPRQLARLLSALPPGLPVVVVDDGSADPGPTRAVAAEFGARLLRHPIGRGPAPRIRSMIIPWKGRSNSWPRASMRGLLETISQCIRLQASLAGSVRPTSPASQLSGL